MSSSAEEPGIQHPEGRDPEPRPGLSVVVPVYDEEESLAALDAELRETLRALGRSAEIVYVDDRSRDGSYVLLQNLAGNKAANRVRTRIARLRRNYGQTAALAAGFQLARSDVILALDGDGQNDPADIPRLLDTLEAGFDVVSGWRRRRRDPFLTRRLPSMIANRLISLVTGLRLHDYGCTLKAYRASLLREVRLYGEMHRYLPAYMSRIGARVTEIEVRHRPRLAGRSKYGPERIAKVLADLVLVRFMSEYYSRPMHFFGRLALGFGLAAVAMLFLMLTFKFGWLQFLGIDYRASFIETPLPALGATFFLGAVASLFFGLLAEILIRVHFESQGLQPFAIDEVTDFGAAAEGASCAES